MIKQTGKAQCKRIKVERVIKQNKIQRQRQHTKVEQNIILHIIKRELSKGTFDNTCTADERMKLRKFISKNYDPSYKHLKVKH